MKIQIKKAPRGASQEGVPVARYLECLKRIFERNNITHLTAGNFSIMSLGNLTYFIRQKWGKTNIETVDLFHEDENVLF